MFLLEMSDTSKFVVFALACIALFVGSKLLSARGSKDPSFPAGSGSQEHQAFLNPADAEDARRRAQAEQPVHPEIRVGRLVLKNFYFAKFNAQTGPPDPFEFADELTVEVRDENTGHTSELQFTVGTPAGLARFLEKNSWESFYTPQAFVIRKYEVESVRDMIMEHLNQEYDENDRLRDQKPGDDPGPIS